MVGGLGEIVKMSLLTTCRPLTGLFTCSGYGRTLGPVAEAFKQGALFSIWTEELLWLVNDNDCGRLDSETASAPKSSSAVDGIMALSPMPVMGTANVVLLSALAGLLTDSVAVSGIGQSAGAAPPTDGGVP